MSRLLEKAIIFNKTQIGDSSKVPKLQTKMNEMHNSKKNWKLTASYAAPPLRLVQAKQALGVGMRELL